MDVYCLMNNIMVAVIKIDMMLTLLTDCCKESSHMKIRVSSRLTWPAALAPVAPVAPGQNKLIVTLSLLSTLSQALLWRKCGQWPPDSSPPSSQRFTFTLVMFKAGMLQ